MNEMTLGTRVERYENGELIPTHSSSETSPQDHPLRTATASSNGREVTVRYAPRVPQSAETTRGSS